MELKNPSHPLFLLPFVWTIIIITNIHAWSQVEHVPSIVNEGVFYINGNRPFTIKTYTARDGLPTSGVYICMQDSRDYLWIGSPLGVCRFDGQHFFNYSRNENLPDMGIYAIHEDAAGKIWVYSGSMYGIDYRTIYPLCHGEPISLNILYANGNPQKQEWWGINHNQSFLIGSPIRKSTQPPKAIGKGYARRIVETDHGSFFSDTSGLFFIDQEGMLTDIGQSVKNNGYIVIMGYWNEKLYFYTRNGVYVYADSRIRKLFDKSLVSDRVFTSYRDSKNRIWIATSHHGILLSKPDEETELDTTGGIPLTWVSSFYEDKANNIWIAYGEGLAKVSEVQWELLNSNSFPFLSDLNTVGIDHLHTVYLFSESNGLIRYRNGKFEFDPKNNFQGQLVDAFCFDHFGQLWAVTRQRRLLRYDGRDVTDLTNRITVTHRALMLDITYDEYRRKVWVASDTLMTAGDDHVSPFKSKNNKIIRVPELILPLKNGNVLVTTLDNQLMLIDRNDSIRSMYFSAQLIPYRIHKWITDPIGNIWISYLGTGLYRCRIDDSDSLKVIEKFTREDGLENENIKSFAFDTQHHLWVSTMTGVSVIHPAETNSNGNKFLYNFSSKDGLPAKGFEYGRLACDADGTMWFSTQFALLKFKANERLHTPLPPHVVIEHIRLDMQETDWGSYTDSLYGFFQLPYALKLKHHENTITFQFKAVTLADNETFQYSYMVKGHRNTWSKGSNSNSTTLANLSPGQYTFLVRARKTNSDWSEPASFTFTIRHALWQHWWFNPVLVLLFCGLIYWLYRFRVMQLNREQRVRRRLASDLHDDIGSTLSSISYYSEAIRQQVKESSPQVLLLLDKMESASDNTIDAMSDIVWMTNPSFDKGKDLLTRMRTYASEVCTLRHVGLEFESDPAFEHVRLHMETRRNLFLIFKEAVNNALKYSGCTLLKIRLGQDMVLIQDNGIGFDPSSMFSGNGLKNMRQRAKEINGKLEIESSTESGTRVVLKF